MFSHFGVPAERSYNDEIKVFDGTQTRKGFETILKYLDPNHLLNRYARWNDEKFTLFLDRDDRAEEDFSLAFKREGVPADPLRLERTLRQTAIASPSASPLQGLRIALDPGHMGGRFWDVKTGKFVATPEGYVSEGVIAWQVCELLGRELEKLGAEVMITRHALAPVTDLDLKTYELKPFALNEIIAESDDGWFDRLLNSAPLGKRLFALFDQSAEIHRIMSEASRDTYFISRADLRARAEKIEAFQPHLSLIVHFDASRVDHTQNGTNAVRGYVPGNLLAGELATRELRYSAVRNLFDGHRWVESGAFTAAVVQGISDAARIKVQTDLNDYQAVRVADGVYARNLALNRLIRTGALAYVEVEHYDYTPEFRRLAVHDRHVEIDGRKIDYSSRLDDIVEGIRKGILEYVGSYATRAQQLP